MFALAWKGCVGLIKEPLVSSLYGAFHCSSVEWKEGLVPAWQAQASGPRVGHLGLNSGPVWRPHVTTSWEGSCFSWLWVGLSTAECVSECISYEDEMSAQESLRMRLDQDAGADARLVWIWLNSVSEGFVCVCVSLWEERNLLILPRIQFTLLFPDKDLS